jgi:hypothetical protein
MLWFFSSFDNLGNKNQMCKTHSPNEIISGCGRSIVVHRYV